MRSTVMTPDRAHLTLVWARRKACHVGNIYAGDIEDKGYQEPGSPPPRKKSKGGELSKKDKECNAEISALRAPVERVISPFKSWRIFPTGYRRPSSTCWGAYDAARGRFFFSLTWGFE
jgi:hypothetical protein